MVRKKGKGRADRFATISRISELGCGETITTPPAQTNILSRLPGRHSYSLLTQQQHLDQASNQRPITTDPSNDQSFMPLDPTLLKPSASKSESRCHLRSHTANDDAESSEISTASGEVAEAPLYDFTDMTRELSSVQKTVKQEEHARIRKETKRFLKEKKAANRSKKNKEDQTRLTEEERKARKAARKARIRERKRNHWKRNRT